MLLLNSLIQEHFIACFRDFERDETAHFKETDDFLSFHTGIRHPWFNCFIDKNSNPINLSRIEAFASELKISQIPGMLFVLNPQSYFPESHILRRKGLVYRETLTNMALELDGGMAGACERTAAFEIKKVKTVDEINTWLDIAAQWWNMPPSELPTVKRMYAGDADQQHDWHFFLGFHNGLPCATSAVFISKNIPGIYYVGTSPEARNVGFGSKMTRMAIEYLVEKRHRCVVLQATEMAKSLYGRMGFQTCGTIAAYQI